jgi:hypothetical protein
MLEKQLTLELLMNPFDNVRYTPSVTKYKKYKNKSNMIYYVMYFKYIFEFFIF